MLLHFRFPSTRTSRNDVDANISFFSVVSYDSTKSTSVNQLMLTLSSYDIHKTQICLRDMVSVTVKINKKKISTSFIDIRY